MQCTTYFRPPHARVQVSVALAAAIYIVSIVSESRKSRRQQVAYVARMRRAPDVPAQSRDARHGDCTRLGCPTRSRY